MKFEKESFLFTIEFKNSYSNISVKVTMELMRRLFFKHQNVIPNVHLILELMELVLSCAVMTFQKSFSNKSWE